MEDIQKISNKKKAIQSCVTRFTLIGSFSSSGEMRKKTKMYSTWVFFFLCQTYLIKFFFIFHEKEDKKIYAIQYKRNIQFYFVFLKYKNWRVLLLSLFFFVKILYKLPSRQILVKLLKNIIVIITIL